MVITNLTKEKRESSESDSPCILCLIGWKMKTETIDKGTGDLLVIRKQCQDECERLSDWGEKQPK